MVKITSRFTEKTVKGKRRRFVFVTIQTKTRKISKQYRFRGGSKRLYEREALLKKGTKYLVDYKRGQIIKSPSRIQTFLKKVKTKRKGVKVTPSKALPPSLILRRVRDAPKPIAAERIVKLMDGKVYYEKVHSIRDFITPEREAKFLRDIVSKGTRSKQASDALISNFGKIALKFSYAINVFGENMQGELVKVGGFTVVGKRPREIVNILKDAGLMPSNQPVNLTGDYGRETPEIQGKLRQHGIFPEQTAFSPGTYKITDVQIGVKFYNNPQRRLT